MKRVIAVILSLCIAFSFPAKTKASSSIQKMSFWGGVADAFSDDGAMSEKKFKKKCKSYNYKKVKNKTSKYKGKKIKIKGKIRYVKKTAFGTNYLIVEDKNNGYYYYVTITKLNSEYDEYHKFNTIRVYGKLDGKKTKIKVGTKKYKVPCINALYEDLWTF